MNNKTNTHVEDIPKDSIVSEDEILSAIVEGSSDGIIRVDAKGIIVSWTQGAERMLGYSRKEIVGKPVEVVVPESFRDEVKHSMQEQMNGEIGVLHTETVRLHKNGNHVNVQLTRIPLQDESGKTVALLAIFKDITEQKKLQKEKKQLKTEQKELQKKLETLQRNTAMARVAAKVAHEIRNPLGALLLQLDLLMERMEELFENWGKDDPEKYRKLLYKNEKKIKRLTSRLEEIANNYLHLSKTRSMEREEVDVERFLNELKVELKEMYAEDDLVLEITVAPGIKTAYFDPQQFQRVFANLVKNSREALIQTKNQSGRVEIHCEEKGNMLEFRVSDNGPGMPEKIRATVFDPFTTTKSIGTGLGLYLACEIVENHQGRITIESQPNQGTTIYITIPLKEP